MPTISVYLSLLDIEKGMAMDEVRMAREAEVIRRAYPAVSAAADAFQEGIPEHIPLPCLGVEFDILERLRVLLALETQRIRSTSLLLNTSWSDVTRSPRGRAAINNAIVVAANGDSIPPDNGLQLSTRP
jgi:hypothetical protein